MSDLVICLMGPTASGKTQLAIELVQHLPCDIISVDSAMVYRGMDIGTAKPTLQERALAPHALLDILDPAQSYSAGQFCTDANQAIANTLAKGRIPLLVGGTMLYFRALQQGLSALPTANQAIRQRLTQEADRIGWEVLHQRLQTVDPVTANRISSHDKQRIQRALEIYELTSKPMSSFAAPALAKQAPYRMVNIALLPEDRSKHQQLISTRFASMLALGFVEEVQKLQQRADIHPDLPSMRAVGYRQLWDFLAGRQNMATTQELAIIATRQLAKRQMTWLRSWPSLTTFNCQEPDLAKKILISLNAIP